MKLSLYDFVKLITEHILWTECYETATDYEKFFTLNDWYAEYLANKFKSNDHIIDYFLG